MTEPAHNSSTTTADIDWESWQARDPATLVFVIRDGEILLIRKKRGIGRGKINGPGGKLDPGENAIDCAARECYEELGITVLNLECMAEHKFQFIDGYSIHCWVFTTQDFEGTPVETDEAAPMWCALDEIPYDEMWEDDRIWLPMVIRGTPVSANWVFDDDRMLDYELHEVDRVIPGRRRSKD